MDPSSTISSLRQQLATWEQAFVADQSRRPTQQDVPPLVLQKYRELGQLVMHQKRAAATQTAVAHDDEVRVDLKRQARLAQKPAAALDLREEDRGRNLADLDGFGFAAKQQPRMSAASDAGLAKAMPLQSVRLPPAQGPPTPLYKATIVRAADGLAIAAPVPVPTAAVAAAAAAAPAAVAAAAAAPPKHVFVLDQLTAPPPPSAPPTRHRHHDNEDPASRKPRKAAPNYQKINLKKRHWQPKKKPGLQRPSKRSRPDLDPNFSRSKPWSSASPAHGPPDDVIATMLDPAAQKSSLAMCHHDEPCVERVVKKAGTGNKGRAFYACGRPRDAQCGFFLWKEDSKASALSAMKHAPASPPRPDFAAMSVSELKAAAHRLGAERPAGRKAALSKSVEGLWAEREAKARELAGADVQTVLEEVFGHEAFLPGQLEVVQQVLGGNSLLVVKSTGSGKSLMYQLPAFKLPGLTLVVSPLVALMQDQLQHLPPGLPGVCLNGSQTQAEQARTLAMLRSGQAKVLFVAPERVVTSSFQRMLRTPGLLPKVALVCVDEAHCVSTWSHNFRPAYLRLGSALRACLPWSPPVLALSASATLQVRTDVCRALGIESQHVVHDSWIRENLTLRVERAHSTSEDRRISRVVQLVQAEASAIVYVTTKHDAALLAERLAAAGVDARAYHAGLAKAVRHKIQAEFMCGKLKVVVATVAFGMGLDKADVRKVVHFRAPRRCARPSRGEHSRGAGSRTGSIEDYVQEVGRAGRDGAKCECHVLFDADGADARRLLSLARGEGLEEAQLAQLVDFVHEALRPDLNPCGLAALGVEKLARELDVKEPVLETICVMLEARGLVELLPSGYKQCVVTLRHTAPAEDILVRAVRRHGAPDEHGRLVLPLLALAQELVLDTPSQAVHALCIARDAGVVAAFAMQEPALFLRRAVDGFDVPGAARELLQVVRSLELAAVNKLHAAFHAMQLGLGGGKSGDDVESGPPAANNSSGDNVAADGAGTNEAMLQFITQYLQGAAPEPAPIPTQELSEAAKLLITADARRIATDPQFKRAPKFARTGRAVARILHGVASPMFARDEWSRRDFWQRHGEFEFDQVVELAEAVLRAARQHAEPKAAPEEGAAEL